MSIKTAYSTESSHESAVTQIKEKLGDIDPKLVLYFASSMYDPGEISRAMSEAFPSADTFGCTTAGEIVTGKMLKGSVVAMGMDEEVAADMNLQIASNISEESNMTKIFARFERHFLESPETMSIHNYVGIILIDGLRMAEERIMDSIGDLTNVFFIGASAGDDLKFSQTHVFANGKAYTDAAILALIKPKRGFDFLKTQSFNPCTKKLIATKVREAERMVVEFNGKPAAQAYAEAVGAESAEKASDYFMTNPVGLIIGDEPYVRSPQRIQDQNMIFYCNVLEGMEMRLLEATDIVKDTQKALEEKLKSMNHVSGIINFHCILRTLELEQKDLMEPYGRLFSDIPTIGFSTYGEEFIGHINQTSTMLLLE
jgi:hypothetical protein